MQLRKKLPKPYLKKVVEDHDEARKSNEWPEFEFRRRDSDSFIVLNYEFEMPEESAVCEDWSITLYKLTVQP